MSGSLHQSHALVTGGSRGIGRAIAAELSRAGSLVTVIGRNQSALEQVVSTGEARFSMVADVLDETAFRTAVAQAAQKHPIDILVASAGAAETASFIGSDAALYRRMMEVNLMGSVHAIRAVLPDMKDRASGRIVLISSTAGLKGYIYASAYAAAKHAVVGLVRSLALELAKSGVTVNAVCPGFTDTDLLAASIENIVKKTGRTRQQATAELAKHNPQGRLVTPQEVANAVLWLCGAGAGAITGQAIAVAGGEI